jgi:hypothetical protein
MLSFEDKNKKRSQSEDRLYETGNFQGQLSELKRDYHEECVCEDDELGEGGPFESFTQLNKMEIKSLSLLINKRFKKPRQRLRLPTALASQHLYIYANEIQINVGTQQPAKHRETPKFAVPKPSGFQLESENYYSIDNDRI